MKLVCLMLVTLAGATAQEEVTVGDLIRAGADFDGDQVVVAGELVGDYGRRPDGWMWTQLNGDAYASQPIGEGGAAVGGNSGIGVRMPLSLKTDLDPPGRYRRRGPIVRLTGVWRYHDPDRQGESYLEVESLVVIEGGRSIDQPPDWRVLVLGLLTGAAALFIWVSRRPASGDDERWRRAHIDEEL